MSKGLLQLTRQIKKIVDHSVLNVANGNSIVYYSMEQFARPLFMVVVFDAKGNSLEEIESESNIEVGLALTEYLLKYNSQGE
jgi:hypothetical protein